MTVTCDDCGSVQPENNPKCELCGASLAEEKQRGGVLRTLKLFGAAIVVSLVLVVAPVFFMQGRIPMDQRFWLGYSAIWLVGGLLARFFSPRDNLEVDRHLWRFQKDGRHMMFGLALFPMGLVFGLWEAAIRSLFGRQ